MSLVRELLEQNLKAFFNEKLKHPNAESYNLKGC